MCQKLADFHGFLGGTELAESRRMAIHVALTHRTTYRYDRSVNLGPQVVRLRSAPHCKTPILSYSLKVERRLLKGLSDVRLLDVAEAIDPRGREQALQTLAQVEQFLCDCSELITLRFFTHFKTSSLGGDRLPLEAPGGI
jgi:hypothetical protein